MYQADRNQAEIIAALRASGCSVALITGVNGASGVPDLMAARDGVTYLMEVKRPKSKGVPAGELSAQQKAWHANWRAPVHVVRSVGEALAAVGLSVADSPR